MENKLIDYDILRILFNDKYKETSRLILCGETHLDNLAEGFLEADRVIRALPTVDAVEVVRCKDCKFYQNHGMRDVVFDVDACHWNADEQPDPDDFCSAGERRE